MFLYINGVKCYALCSVNQRCNFCNVVMSKCLLAPAVGSDHYLVSPTLLQMRRNCPCHLCYKKKYVSFFLFCFFLIIPHNTTHKLLKKKNIFLHLQI